MNDDKAKSPENDDRGLVERTVESATAVLTDPRGFFTDRPADEPLEQPLVFAGLMLMVSAVLQAVLALIGLVPGGFFVSLVFVPIGGAIGLLVAAAIVFFASKALGGETASFDSSVRIVAWTSAILPVQTVFGVIPYLPLLAIAYAFYITIVAVIVVNRVNEDRAWMILGGAGAILLVLLLVSTFTGRRTADRLERWGTHLERSAEELGKAAAQLRREREREDD